MPLKEIALEGTPYERGLAHGAEFKQEILMATQSERETLRYRASDQLLENMLEACLTYLNVYAPDLIEEVRGIADSVSVPFEDVLLLNYTLEFTDLFSDTLYESLTHSLGCTSFAVRTERGEVFIGQNYDWRLYPIVILYIKASGIPDILCITIPGMVGCAGVNAAGLGVVINKLTPRDSRLGVAYPFVLRKVLEADNVTSALASITSAHRASGLCYIVANTGGDIFCLETTATDFEVILPSGSHICHTNHYLHPRLIGYDGRVADARAMNSYVRLQRMNRLLNECGDSIEVGVLKGFLSDHMGFPESICSHPRVEVEAGTIASVVMEMNAQTMWVANGNPCKNEFESRAFHKGTKQGSS
jgi:isopenicillin-N N-acyltransferase-like protein